MSSSREKNPLQARQGQSRIAVEKNAACGVVALGVSFWVLPLSNCRYHRPGSSQALCVLLFAVVLCFELFSAVSLIASR